MDLTGWHQEGWAVLYLDADNRLEDGLRDHRGPRAAVGERVLPYDGRGVMTYYGEDGKNSGQPPADDLRLVWNDEYKVWNLYVPDQEN